MDRDVKYIDYFSVFAKHKWRLIIATILAFILMFVWCTFGIPPMKKKWAGKVGLIYQLQKSSLAIRRTLGSLDLPVGGLGGILGGAGTAYNNIPILNSRRVIIEVLDQHPEAKQQLTKGQDMDEDSIAKQFRKRLKIDDSTDGYLEITVLWENRDIAADLANSLVEIMQSTMWELNRENANFMSQFLQARLKVMEGKMDKADNSVRQFKEEHGILAVDEQATELVKTYSLLMLDYTTAEMEFTEAATRWKLVNDEKKELADYIRENVPQKDVFDLTELKDDPIITLYDHGVILEHVPAVESLGDDSIGKLRRDISELVLQLGHKRMMFTDEHPDVLTLKKKIYEAKRTLYQELENYTRSATLSLDIERQAFRAKREVISSIIGDLESEIDSFPSKEADLIRLIRDQKIYDEIYILLMQEYEQALLAEERPETTFQVLDKAVPINRPTRPRKVPYSLGFAILMFTGFLLHSYYIESKRIQLENEG